MPEAVIVATARSPIGRAGKGSLTSIRPDDLAAQMVTAALAKVPQLDPADIGDLILGCGLPGGEQGFNMARVIAILLGHDHLPGTTVNRYCSSSLQTTRMAFHAIKAGEGDVYISAGVECVSRLAKGSSDSWPDTHNQAFSDSRLRAERIAAGEAGAWRDPREDGLMPDIYVAMGQTAENVAELRGVSREQQDEFGVRSQNLAALKPVFRPDGTVTAGNCCPLNDGAAAVVVMSDVKAAELGITPLARIVSSGVTALSPEIMGLGPVEASRQALARAGMAIADIDLVEINEAFAAQVIPSYNDLGIDLAKLNVN